MEVNECEARILTNQLVTITEYATYVLSHPKIKEALAKFEVYQHTADRFIDSIVGMVDTEGLPLLLESNAEQLALQEMIKDMESLKNCALLRYTDFLPLKPWPITRIDCLGFNNGLTQAQREEKSSITLQNGSLYLFKEFVQNPDFNRYFTHGDMPLIAKGNTRMSRETELLAVLSLYLWAIPLATTDIFTLSTRKRGRHPNIVKFLSKYKEYICLDNTGSIQLLFDTFEWGKMRIKDEAEIYGLDSHSLDHLEEIFFPAECHAMYCTSCLKPRGSSYLFDGQLIFCSVSCSLAYNTL